MAIWCNGVFLSAWKLVGNVGCCNHVCFVHMIHVLYCSHELWGWASIPFRNVALARLTMRKDCCASAHAWLNQGTMGASRPDAFSIQNKHTANYSRSQTIPTMRNFYPTFRIKTSSSLETSLVSCDRVISNVFPGRQHANGFSIHGKFQIPLFNLLDVHNSHLGVHMASSVAMKAIAAPIVSALWHMHRTPM